MVGEDDEAASVAATGDAAVGRIEIVAERRRAHPASFRAMVVAESLRLTRGCGIWRAGMGLARA